MKLGIGGMASISAQVAREVSVVHFVERNPDIVWRSEGLAEEELLAAMRRGDDVSERSVVTLEFDGVMHRLSLLAGRVWELADGTRTSRDIAAEIASEFSWEQTAVGADVDDFVQDLLAKGWLRHVSV